MDIEPLLERIKAGDRQAFAEVVQGYEKPLFAFLGRMALRRALAEEIAQETFIRVWQNMADYRPQHGAFSTWLFTIARHLALNELARASTRRERSVEVLLEEPLCPGAAPPDVAVDHQSARRLRSALSQMPLRDRSILALAYVRELDLAAVARIEGCPVGVLKVRLYRAKRTLRQLLETHHE